MNRLLKLLVVLISVQFLVTGLRWLVAPGGIALQFGLTLEHGVGLSTQVGDMSAFFLLLGVCILTALVSGRRSWYYPPTILLLLTGFGRILAWLLHDAALAVNFIVPELVIPLILLLASRRLADRA